MTNNTKTGKNKNVDLRVPEESEKVLVEDRVSSTNGVEEYSFEVTIKKEHGNCTRKYGERKK